MTGCVGIWEGELVDGSVDARVGDGPFEVSRGLAAHRLVAMPARVASIRRGTTASGAGGRHHLGDTEVALWGRSEEIRLLVKVGVDVRIEGVVWLAVGCDDEGRKMVGDGSMVGRCVDRVDCRHDGQRSVGSVPVLKLVLYMYDGIQHSNRCMSYSELPAQCD